MRTTRNVALAAVIGVSAAAGSLVAAPVATADCNDWSDCWGAVAVSPTPGAGVSIQVNRHDIGQAEFDAQMACNVEGKTNDCVVVRSGTGCFSVAQSADHINITVAARNAPTLEAADAEALDGAGPGSTILTHDCNAPE